MTPIETKVVEYLNQGRTQMSIAAELRCSQSTVCRWGKRLGVVCQKPGRRKKC